MTAKKRRTATIMSTDVVGYSYLMGQNEDRTLNAVDELLKCIIVPNVLKFGGRIFKLLGDGTLAVFESVADAVKCAIAIQTGLRDSELAIEDRLALRIGINLADVIIQGDDVFGDGVNVAARLQSIAEPGGICLDDAVYRQVARQVDVGFEDGGLVSLKNIISARQVWHWPLKAPLSSKGQQTMSADAMASVASRPLARAEGTALGHIVVRLTQVPANSEAHQIMAEQITERVGQILTHLRWVDVTEKHLSNDARSERDTRDYSLVVRAFGSQELSVNVKLLATTNHQLLWSGAFENVDLDDLPSIKDAASEIAALLEDKILTIACDRLATETPDAWSAYDNFLIGRQFELRHLPFKAEPCFRRATELEPNMIYAHAGRAMALLSGFCQTASSDLIEAAEKVCHTALAIDINDAAAHSSSGFLKLMLRDFRGAKLHYARAMKLAPNDLTIRADYAEMLHFMGDLDGALNEIEICFSSTSRPPVWCWQCRGQTLIQMGRAEDAIHDLDNVPEKSWRTCLLLAVAYRLSENDGMVRRWLSQAYELRPNLAPDLVRATYPYLHDHSLQKLLGVLEGK